jgi:hypothetical protein
MKTLIATAMLALALIASPARYRVASDAPPSYENILDEIANSPDLVS